MTNGEWSERRKSHGKAKQVEWQQEELWKQHEELRQEAARMELEGPGVVSCNARSQHSDRGDVLSLYANITWFTGGLSIIPSPPPPKKDPFHHFLQLQLAVHAGKRKSKTVPLRRPKGTRQGTAGTP